jgi:hypothetical protein
LFQRYDVVAGNEVDAGEERLKIAAIFFLAGDGERTEGPSMKRIFEGDDFDFLGRDFASMRASHFERAFHGFGAGVGKENAIESAGFGDALGEGSLIFVVVEVGRVEDEAGLLAKDFGEPGMGIAERVDADAGDQIEISFAGGVVNIAALSAMQHQRVAGVILKQVLFFQVDYGRGRDGCHLFMINKMARVARGRDGFAFSAGTSSSCRVFYVASDYRKWDNHSRWYDRDDFACQ